MVLQYVAIRDSKTIQDTVLVLLIILLYFRAIVKLTICVSIIKLPKMPRCRSATIGQKVVGEELRQVHHRINKLALFMYSTSTSAKVVQ